MTNHRVRVKPPERRPAGNFERSPACAKLISAVAPLTSAAKLDGCISQATRRSHRLMLQAAPMK